MPRCICQLSLINQHRFLAFPLAHMPSSNESRVSARSQALCAGTQVVNQMDKVSVLRRFHPEGKADFKNKSWLSNSVVGTIKDKYRAQGHQRRSYLAQLGVGEGFSEEGSLPTYERQQELLRQESRRASQAQRTIYRAWDLNGLLETTNAKT